jgi:hypothetical protein
MAKSEMAHWEDQTCSVSGCYFHVWRDRTGLCYGHEKNLLEFPESSPDPRKEDKKKAA